MHHAGDVSARTAYIFFSLWNVAVQLEPKIVRKTAGDDRATCSLPVEDHLSINGSFAKNNGNIGPDRC